MPSLAKRIAAASYLAPAMIGSAAFDLKRDPNAWSDRGTYQDVLQELKVLWHVLVKFGHPFRGSPLHRHAAESANSHSHPMTYFI